MCIVWVLIRRDAHCQLMTLFLWKASVMSFCVFQETPLHRNTSTTSCNTTIPKIVVTSQLSLLRNSKSFQATSRSGVSDLKDIELKNQKNLLYTRDITPKRVTSGRAHPRGIASEQHSSEKTSLRYRAVGDTVSGLIGPGIEPQTYRIDGDVLTTALNSTGLREIGWEVSFRSSRQHLPGSIFRMVV